MAEQDDRDALAEALAAHNAIGYDDVEGCECGDDADVSHRDHHHQHVATAILASDWLAQRDRRVAAETWDEAVASAYLHETEHWTGIKHAPNPYRADRIENET